MSGLFVAGGAVAGVDTGTIFIENGRFHGERIIDVIARRTLKQPPSANGASTHAAGQTAFWIWRLETATK